MIDSRKALDILFNELLECKRAIKIAAEECYYEEVEQPDTVDMIIAEEEIPYKDEWITEKIEGWLKQAREEK